MSQDSSNIAQVYCTWSFLHNLPPPLRAHFRDLDHFLRDVVSSATKHLLVVAPFLSPTGMSFLRGAMATAAQHGAWIRLVTSSLDDLAGPNWRALRNLVEGKEGKLVYQRLRVLSGTGDASTLFPAKIVVSDRTRGYLGSANLSLGGLERNFEVGAALTSAQAAALDDLLTYFEAQGLLKDWTRMMPAT